MTKLGDTKWDKEKLPQKKRLGHEDKQAMAEYYQAGLKTGKSSEELLAELEERYSKSPRQIQRYIRAVIEKPVQIAAENSGTKQQTPYEEGPHEHKMPDLASKLTQEVRSPEIDPIQLAHLRSLKKFLQEDPRIRDSFSIDLGRDMEWILKQVVPRCAIYLPASNFPWEELPVVSKIKSHCPENQLWKDIDEWKITHAEYWQSILHVAKKLQAEFRGSLDFPGSEINDPTLERHLLLDIFNWLAGQLLGNVPPNYGGFHTYVFIQNEKILMDNVRPNDRVLYNAWKGQIAWGDTCYAQGTVEQIERARRAAEDVLKQWSDSDDMRSLVRQFYSLEDLAQRVRDDIEHIDEAVLAQGDCPDCPILRS